VADQGKGMSREFIETRLFQPFHTTKPDGLGIGLFQSKKIIESYDGTIEVESREGEGTIVRIVLPLPKPQEASVEQNSPAEVVDIQTKEAIRRVATA